MTAYRSIINRSGNRKVWTDYSSIYALVDSSLFIRGSMKRNGQHCGTARRNRPESGRWSNVACSDVGNFYVDVYMTLNCVYRIDS